MSTVTIQIGNSDDKLTQAEWAEFIAEVQSDMIACRVRVHFFGTSAGNARWQNAAWVVEGNDRALGYLRKWVTERREKYRQDSAAWTVGETEFV